jgi:hypothetical protein
MAKPKKAIINAEDSTKPGKKETSKKAPSKATGAISSSDMSILLKVSRTFTTQLYVL